MLLRIIVAAAGIPIILLIIHSSLLIFSCFVFLIILLGLLEYSKMLSAKKISAYKMPIIILGAMCPVFFYCEINFGLPLIEFIAILCPVVLFVIQIFRKDLSTAIRDTGSALLGIFYIGFLTSHLILLKNLENGIFYLLLLFIVIWFSDTAGYLAWKIMGLKRHLIPLKVSPNKSYEGYVAGLILSVMGALFTVWIFSGRNVFSQSQLIIAGLLIGVVGFIGDLAESSLKRDAGIKDSGFILPGHGGVLDRFDSIIFAAPLFYYLLVFKLL